MILEALLRVLFGLIDTLISLIPTITIPNSFIALSGDVSTLINAISYFLPLGTITICLSVIFILQNARFFMSIFNFIIRKIPGMN